MVCAQSKCVDDDDCNLIYACSETRFFGFSASLGKVDMAMEFKMMVWEIKWDIEYWKVK